MTNTMTLWQPESGQLLPNAAKTPNAIAEYASQLSKKDKRQIVSAFEATHYEMGLNFLWMRTVSALKRELATVGLSLLGEMLGKTDVDQDDDVEDILTSRDTIRLAEELGVVTSTDAMRLRHMHEFVTHFNQLSHQEDEQEDIDEAEAIASLKTCVKAVLGRPKVEVAADFIEFRNALETETLAADGPEARKLVSSPYFFRKLTISILLNSAKSAVGAPLEHSLANTNVLIPLLWPKLRHTEKWQVGHTYAEVYSEGKKSSVAGLKQALIKVQGFDFVPETLRSDTFVKSAEAVLRAHDGLNNFYAESSPVRSLSRLGTSIPIPALSICMTALLSVGLGNMYGNSWTASPVALNMLTGLGKDRWQFYLNQVLPADERILNKLVLPKPQAQWMELVGRYELTELQMKDHHVSQLVKASSEKNGNIVGKAAKKLLARYYGKT